MKILITGSNGYIGSSIYSKISSLYDITKISRNDLDLTNSKEVFSFFKDKNFDVILHCAIQGGNRLVEDTEETLNNNLKIFENIIAVKNSFNKLINFGSGAEIYNPYSFYGYSKKYISELMKKETNFINLRLFAVFDENELDRRFIKSNLINYINKNPMKIDMDKYMDFIYMNDLIEIIKYFIDNESIINEFDCVYEKKYKLSNICEHINNLSNYKVPVNITSKDTDFNYIGNYNDIGLKFVGLKKGIENTFTNLKLMK